MLISGKESEFIDNLFGILPGRGGINITYKPLLQINR